MIKFIKAKFIIYLKKYLIISNNKNMRLSKSKRKI